MKKKELTEADIRTKFITPALVGLNGGKWNAMTQLREEVYFTRGRVIVRGRTVHRGEARKADYLLYYKPAIPIAVIEAKDKNTPSAPSCSRRSNTPRSSTCRLPTVRTATPF
jgi:type I restriction enzyme R subunit